jgi:hypothetical protein
VHVHALLRAAVRTQRKVKSIHRAAFNASSVLPKAAEDDAEPPGHM